MRPVADPYAAIDRLVVKQGLTFANLSRGDRLLALALAARCLPPATPCDEAAANAALKAWLAGTGAMLHTDHVELRRALIDIGAWQRDAFGRRYERLTTVAEADLAAQLEALAALEPEPHIAAVRARHVEERARRKARAT